MGGSDDPSNLVELTYDQHIEAHRLLCEQFPDHFGLRFAYLNMINLSEHAHKEACSRGGKNSAKAGGPRLGGLKGGKTAGKITGTRNLHDWHKKNPEKSAKISADNGCLTSKKVICIETGEVFDSINHAMRAINSPNIARAIRTGIRAAGFHWEYKNDQI